MERRIPKVLKRDADTRERRRDVATRWDVIEASERHINSDLATRRTERGEGTQGRDISDSEDESARFDTVGKCADHRCFARFSRKAIAIDARNVVSTEPLGEACDAVVGRASAG